jgi:hypothetical protein
MHHIFDTLVRDSKKTTDEKISTAEYKKWKKIFSFDALRGKKYGESFCEYFKIRDYRILFASPPDADRLILSTWVA